jgi:hypothetical protein
MIKVKLENEIDFLGKVITQVAWRVNYPDNEMYFELQTEKGDNLKNGNWSVPVEVVNSWGLDDSVISNALLEAKPWVAKKENKVMPVYEEQQKISETTEDQNNEHGEI